MPTVSKSGEDFAKAVASARRSLIAEIKRLLKPHMWESGFVRRRLSPEVNEYEKVWLRKDQAPIKINGCYMLQEFVGFTQDAIIVDAYVGISTLGFSGVCTDDLLKIRNWIVQNVPEQGQPAGRSK